MLLNHRPAIFVAVVAASLTAITPPVEAGWLCDWLCGRHAPVQPVIPVAPVAAATQPSYSAGFAPVAAAAPAETSYCVPAATAATAATAPVTAFSPPVTSDSAPVTSFAPPVTAYSPPVKDNGAVAAQMPAYGAAVPAALPTGYAGIYSSYYGAAPQQAVIAPAPVTSFYGTGNIYPDAHAASPGVVTANYAAASPPQAIINPQPRHGLLGGIGRFFGSMFGTHYQTSSIRAPVTQYRPVTTLSPTTGAATTVQQPCTTFENQVQRSPISGFQQAPAAPSACCTPAPLPTTMAPATGFPASQAGEGAEGFVPQPTLPSDSFDPYASQMSGYGAYSNGTQASPSFAPRSGSDLNCPPADTSPLIGSPPNGDSGDINGSPFNGGGEADDRQPVEQPQLDSAPSPSLRGYRQIPDNGATTNSSGWRRTTPVPAASEPASPRRNARPIPAPRSAWPTPAESTEETSGRTATRDGWSSKRIQWASHPQPNPTEAADRSRQSISEPTSDSPSQVRRANHVAEPAASNDADHAWQSAVPQRTLKDRSPWADRTPPKQRERPRYDDSGWE